MCILGFSVSHLLQRKTGRGILILMENYLSFAIVIKAIVIMMLLSNIPMSVYFSMIHQRGDVSIMKYLRKVIKLMIFLTLSPL